MMSPDPYSSSDEVFIKEKIDKIGDLKFWLAKSQIVEGKEDLENSLK